MRIFVGVPMFTSICCGLVVVYNKSTSAVTRRTGASDRRIVALLVLIIHESPTPLVLFVSSEVLWVVQQIDSSSDLDI